MDTNEAVWGVLGHAARYVQEAQAYALGMIPRLITAALLMAILWVGARMVQGVIMRVARRGDAAVYEVLQLTGRIVFGTLMVLGVIMALDTVGVKVNAIIAGLGLSGFAFGLATRDALTNVVSGFLIIIYRPFRRGDRIVVAGIEGTVSNVDLRYTTLCTDDRTVLIPNSTMFNSTVVIVQKRTQTP